MQSIMIYKSNRETPAAILKLPLLEITTLDVLDMIYRNNGDDPETDWIANIGVTLSDIAEALEDI